MKRALAALGVLGLLAVVVSSCSDPVRPRAPGRLDLIAGQIDSVGGRVRFRVAESHDHPAEVGDPRIYLQLETERIYPCSNFSIDAGVEVSGGEVRVILRGIRAPEICLTSLGPAGFRAPLDLAPGEYRLAFTDGSKSYVYALTVTASAIEIGDLSATDVYPAAIRVWRYPPRSFALLCGTAGKNAWIEPDLAAAIRAVPGVQEFKFPEGGEIPYPLASSGHAVDFPARYFRYGTEADFEAVGAMFEEYSRRVIEPEDGVTAYLLSWRNQVYRSWQVGL